MSVITRNILANLAGKTWAGLIWLAFVPVYLSFMGVEAYGLVGLFFTLTAVLSTLDLGLSTTINRELARLSAQGEKRGSMRDVLRTLESLYWAIALLIGTALVVSSPLIAQYWLKPEALSPEAVRLTVVLIGLTIAVQWPSALYTGGLLGIQRHVLLNGVVSSIVTVRAVGAVMVLWLLSPTPQAFFAWQLLMGVLHTAALGYCLWRSLAQPNHRARFDPQLLRGLWRYAAGASGIAIFGTLAAQLDKIILSAILPLDAFGYYSIAALVASALYYLIAPITSSVFPRFAQLGASQANVDLARTYHKSCQLAAVATLPAAVFVALFSYEILELWTRNTQVAQQAHIVLSILMAGTALNGLVLLSFSLQLASGLVKLGLYANLSSVIIAAPCLVYFASRYGATGGAAVWLLLNLGLFVIVVPMMHRFLPTVQDLRWYAVDTMRPLGASVLVLALARWLIPERQPDFTMAAYLAVALAASYAAAILAAPDVRKLALERMNWKRGSRQL